jgi:hypothetical protein
MLKPKTKIVARALTSNCTNKSSERDAAIYPDPTTASAIKPVPRNSEKYLRIAMRIR